MLRCLLANVSTRNPRLATLRFMTVSKSPHNWTPGVDVSAAQGALDWGLVGAAGIRWAVLKASEGPGYVDPTYYRNSELCRAQGIIQGAYHFAVVSRDPVEQARHFHEVVGRVHLDDLSSVLDYEPKPDALTSKQHCVWIDRFCDEYEALSGRQCIVYTGAFVVGGFSFKDVSDRPLWLAQYTSEVRWLPSQWQDWAFWQYSGDGGERLPGVKIDIDRDWFHGDEHALNTFILRPQLGAPTYPLTTTRGVQRALQQLGHNPGAIDNKWGENTRHAMNEYQGSIGIPATQDATARTREELGESLRNLEKHVPSNVLFKPVDVLEVQSANRFISEVFGYELRGDGMCAGDCPSDA